MVAAPHFNSDEAVALDTLNSGKKRAAIGLHVTLTAPFGPLSADFSPLRKGRFLPLNDILRAAVARRLRPETFTIEIATQLQMFMDVFGRPPEFLDGHQHVHLFPQIRDAFLKVAAQDPDVERIFVNRSIKQALCRDVKGDRSWLHKIRPVIGHNYHFHVRISCPRDSVECKTQPSTPFDEGCGKDLDWWFTRNLGEPKPSGAVRPILMSALPPACRQILVAPGPSAPSAAPAPPAAAALPN